MHTTAWKPHVMHQVSKSATPGDRLAKVGWHLMSLPFNLGYAGGSWHSGFTVCVAVLWTLCFAGWSSSQSGNYIVSVSNDAIFPCYLLLRCVYNIFSESSQKRLEFNNEFQMRCQLHKSSGREDLKLYYPICSLFQWISEDRPVMYSRRPFSSISVIIYLDIDLPEEL